MAHCTAIGSLDVSDLLLYSYFQTVTTWRIFLMTTAATAVATTWKVDPSHSHAEFAVRHLMISTVKGRFTEVTGTLTGDDTEPETASIELTIPVAGIDT